MATSPLKQKTSTSSELRFSSSYAAFARRETCCRPSATCPPNGLWAVATFRRINADPALTRDCIQHKLTLVLKYWRWIFSLKGKILVIWNFSRFDFILITFNAKKKGGVITHPGYNSACYRTEIPHLFLQKRRVHGETWPEVSQQLSSSRIKMLQLSLDISGDHLWDSQGFGNKGEHRAHSKGVIQSVCVTHSRLIVCRVAACMRMPPGESAAMAELAAVLHNTCRGRNIF